MSWRKKGMTKVWAALIQKERKLAPREETKSRFLKSLRSTKGEGDRSSTRINRPRQSRRRKNHTHKRGSDPRAIRFRKRRREARKRKIRRAPKRSTRGFSVEPSFSRTFEER
jgi:hypothetical protein